MQYCWISWATMGAVKLETTVGPVHEAKKNEAKLKSVLLPGYNVMQSVEIDRRFGGTSSPSLGSVKLCLPPAFTLDSCSAYSSTLNMEAMFLRNVG
jgi:hypothetical protein